MSASGETNTGAEMGNQESSPADERPPPPPPKEMSTWRAATLPAATLETAALVASSSPISSRLKKKVPWKGKNIMVLLPWDDERGQTNKAPTPMTDKDVEAMLNEWEQLGYDTAGFNLGQPIGYNEEGAQCQSRNIWPDATDILRERDQRSFRVSIPDRREWDAYVQELSEAKLRALGVTLGDEEPVPTISPAMSNMSRQTSMQYPAIPFSPPLPTSSAASSHLNRNPNPFSPPLMPAAGLSTSQSSNPGSVASPASMHAQLQGKFNPRQSVSFGPGEHPFGSPFQYPQQQSPGIWSPQQMIFQQGAPRGGSPSLQNLGAIVSPSSPFSQDGYFPQGDILSHMHQRQQLLQNQLHQQQQIQLQAGPRVSPLKEVREPEDDDSLAASKSPSKTPEARQIRHNPSASLQKEIDDAEYHLEEQFQRQLEHEDYSPHSDEEDDATRFKSTSSPGHIRNASSANNGLGASRYAHDPEDGPILHHPQPHSRGHSLSQRPFHDSEESAAESKSGLLQSSNAGKEDLSDIETNLSDLGTPHPHGLSGSGHERSLSASSNPWVDSGPNLTEDSSEPRRPGHVSKPSMSKLNVAAKEFKFDPTSSFKPSQFTFNGNNFQPPVTAYSIFSPNIPMSTTSSHLSNQSIGSSRSKINVAAPAFTPGQSEFSFSASGPSFRPDAPAFTPLSNNFSESVGSVNSGSEGPRTSIFGNIDLSAIGITKPSKKSKAIPIVRPDSSHSKRLEDEVMDVDGRITQGEGRIKRARGAREDGDSVPLFAERSMPLGETSREQSPPKEILPRENTPANKENSAPLSDSQEIVPEIPSKSESRDLSQDSPDLGKDWSPYEFQQQKHAEDFNTARPFTQSKRYGSGLPAYGLPSPEQEHAKPVPPKGHKKNSLSATAKPFEFRPGPLSFTFGAESEPAAAPAETPKPLISAGLGGLSASRFARSPTPPVQADSPELLPHERSDFQVSLPQPESPPTYAGDAEPEPLEDREPTFEEIDAVMQHLNEVEMDSAPVRDIDTPRWHQPSPTRRIQVPDLDNSSPIRLAPHNLMRSDAPSPSPRRFQALPGEVITERIFSSTNDDPFIGDSQPTLPFEESPIHRLNNGSSIPASDWDDVLSETEDIKLQARAQFFDHHVNDLVGGLLDQRLDPLERTLETIQLSLDMMAAREPSIRRDRRSVSGALSDADDEDEDQELPRRSLSPRRDKKLEKIRSIVTEALAAHQSSRPSTADAVTSILPDSRNVLQALEEMKEQFGQSMRLDLRGEDLRNIVEDAVERRMPASPKPNVDEAALARDAEQKARIVQLEERLQRAEAKSEEEISSRRAAEDRLSQVQRLLRISTEEEMRLRESMDERELKIREIVDESDQKVRNVEEQRAKTTMRIALLEAAQDNAQKMQSDLGNRINITENELRESQKEVQHWQMEAERALEAARRHSEDAEQANETNKDLRRTIESLRTQMEESIRVREGMRGKLMDLQEDMATAARDISEENSRRAKREQELLARQEVLDAKLQAEARTRERLEREIERLEGGEREGMRAVRDCEKLEALVTELRTENHNAQKETMRYQREFEEARESGMSEMQRTRHYMQAEIESANNQVNVVREDLENQVSRLQAEIDQVKLDADSEREKHAMLLEEAHSSKKALLDDLKRRHDNEVEDMQTRHNRQLSNTVEDAQRSEQHLLERLSLSSAKTEHLQDRVQHLEEKLEIAKSAANAAAVHAKAARSASGSSSQPASFQKAIARDPRMELPEKISPQALRESIMVLQEQLQEREQTIEQQEQTLSKVDPDAAIKISKRDDEILWLRELLSVRKSDLQDIISTLQEGDDFDLERVKDAAIRLKANLQMEEQERERALNGGSAISNLPNIAASIRDAATPRVAQAVGPLAAAWGNWRKGREELGRDSTPRRNSPGAQSFLSGLMTPPASSLRTPPSGSASQPTAFGSTGQRFTAQQLANRPRTVTPRRAEKMPLRGSPRKGGPSTPPMMRKASYDSDARAEDFSDAGFYDDDESTVDDSLYGANALGR